MNNPLISSTEAQVKPVTSMPLREPTQSPAGGFRTCPTTGLKVHRDADNLIKANAVVATVALLIGGIAAILILLTRWQTVHLLSDEQFYRWLTIHGMNMLIFFILFFEMAVLYFASAVLLNARVPAPKFGWVAFALMVLDLVEP